MRRKFTLGHHGLVDQRNDLAQVTALDGLVTLDGIEHIGGKALDHRVGRLVRRQRGQRQAQRCRCGNTHGHAAQ
jgi:hypothetical protein